MADNTTDNTTNTTNTTIKTTINTTNHTKNTTSKPKNIINFNTKTIDDESITSDIFKDYKITMINIWATWCGPCVAEMPELSKLYDELPEGSNLIGIVIDSADESAKQDAINILSRYSIKYKNLIPDIDIANYVNKNIGGIPTSIFVDKDGNIIGDPQMGAPSKKGNGDIVLGYKKLIEERILVVSD